MRWHSEEWTLEPLTQGRCRRPRGATGTRPRQLRPSEVAEGTGRDLGCPEPRGPELARPHGTAALSSALRTQRCRLPQGRREAQREFPTCRPLLEQIYLSVLFLSSFPDPNLRGSRRATVSGARLIVGFCRFNLRPGLTSPGISPSRPAAPFQHRPVPCGGGSLPHGIVGRGPGVLTPGQAAVPPLPRPVLPPWHMAMPPPCSPLHSRVRLGGAGGTAL